MQPAVAYESLRSRSREVALLGSCSAVLAWDEQTYMPRAGGPYRGEQMALLAGLAHQKATDPRFGEWLTIVEASDLVEGSDRPEGANVREWRRRYDRAVKLPSDLVESIARAEIQTQQAWVEARKRNEFVHLRPHLEALVGLERRKAECLSDSGSLYDALLDEYEPGMTGAELEPLFAELRPALVELLDRHAERADATPSVLERNYPVDRQRLFTELVAGALGFDFEAGRIDLTAHPFCSGIGPGDCRLTARYRPDSLSEGLYAVLHEAGHGMYEQGLDPQHFGTPLGEAASLGVHESQSRFWENAIGRSLRFWAGWLPVARTFFPESLRGVTPEEIHRAVNRIRRSLIRIEADEVSYNLHVAIRFRLERDLITGDLQVADLPGAWNEAYRNDLGLTPSSDSEGCLQDIHWSAGLFGYFPTYTLGNLLAAQIARAMRQDLPDLDSRIAVRDFQGILDWLRTRIHRHGRRYSLGELAQRATGSALSSQPLIESLRARCDALAATG